jgi:hypothetical protein
MKIIKHHDKSDQDTTCMEYSKIHTGLTKCNYNKQVLSV